jgi:DNA polymerase III subunit epsilon
MCAAVIIDTESNGLFDYSKPAEAEGQPRMAALAMIFCNDNLDVVDEIDVLVRPEGWQMTEEATRVNGLSTEKLMDLGIPIKSVLPSYVRAVESGRVFVGHNVRHDLKLCRAELRLAGMPDLFEHTQNICTMRASVGVCKIPKAKGGGYKFPKLAEAYRHFFKRDFDFPHSALADARACLAIFRKLNEIGCCPEAAVHFAQEGTRAGEALRLRQEADAQREFTRGTAESSEETMGTAHGQDEEPIF